MRCRFASMRKAVAWEKRSGAPRDYTGAGGGEPAAGASIAKGRRAAPAPTGHCCRLAVSPAASSTISAVISSCRTRRSLARSVESWRSISLCAEAIASMRASFSAAKACSAAWQSCAWMYSAASSRRRVADVQVQQRRIGVRRARKGGQVEGEQASALDLGAAPGLPMGEDGVEPIDRAGGDARVKRLDDAVGEFGDAAGMGRHRAFPAGDDAPFGGDRRPPRADQEQLRRGEIGADRVEHALAEGAGKSLFGAEQRPAPCGTIDAGRRGGRAAPTRSPGRSRAAIVAA